MDSNKYDLLIGLSGTAIFIGFVLFFVNLLIGIIVFAGGIICFSSLSKKYPSLHSEWMEKYSKEHTKPIPQATSKKKEFFVTHIEGINFVNPNQKVYCITYSDAINFVDKSQTILSSVKYNDIKNAIILEEITETKKNKSVIGRAIVGGLLLGPVAAVVGGISGACPSFNTNKKYYLEISLPENYYDNIVITADNKVLKDLKKIIADKLSTSVGNN